MRVTNTLVGLAISIAALSVSDPARAAITIDIQEIGSDVVADTSGAIDIAGLAFVGSPSTDARIRPSIAQFGSAEGDVDVYAGLAGPMSFGSGGLVQTPSFSGDAIYFVASHGYLGVPDHYVSGAPLSATTTFVDHTFVSLGLTPGTYEYTLPNDDTLTVRIGAATAAVPEPATWATMLLGFFALGGVMRSGRTPRVRARA